MSVETVQMDDKALFDGATATEAPAQAEATPEAAPTEQADSGQKHDPATGRFLPKSDTDQQEAPAEAVKAEPSVTEKPAPVPQEPPPGHIPAWRAREIADNAVRRETARLQAELAKHEKPQEPIDPYVDPEKFRDAGVRQAVDPIAEQLGKVREHYSWKDALRTHGQETAIEARKWFYEAVHAGDPNVQPLLQKALASIDPFEDIVSAFKQHKALATVGADPEAWFQSELERRKADPEFVSKYLTPAQQAAQGSPTNSIVRLPPSLNRQPGSSAANDAGSLNDADLYRHATG